MIGQTISHYKILEKLGSGGMGEVYVAEDTKLHRNVALKILPPEMASKERRHRFEREAQAIAALNHPHIVTVFSVEEAEGVHFITMELVKGKTLSELIHKKELPLNKFFEIAIPLADAVSVAHEQGIIHRDLKPDNLMVSDDGRLKILDFGLAKLKQGFSDAGASEFPTQSATGEGRILGTVAYMSPEQAEGKKVDHRSDIFSLGIILYEMATGERPFKGGTTASMLSSILRDTPTSVTEVNPDMPRELSKIIRRCLVKDPGRRYQTALDLRNELEELKEEVDSGEVAVGAAALPPSASGKKWMLAVAGAVVITAVVTYLIRPSREVTEPQSGLIVGSFTRLTSRVGQESSPNLSPDGEFFVYTSGISGNEDIYQQRVGGETTFNLTEDSKDHDRQPAFSPDGKQIAFRSEREGGGIFLMGATGESVRRLTDFGYGPAWSPDGRYIVVGTDIGSTISRLSKSQLWKIDIRTGDRSLILSEDGITPHWSPNGHRVAYSSNQTGPDIWSIPANGGEPVRITQHEAMDAEPTWSPGGHHLYFISNRAGSRNIWRIRIDEETGQTLGNPEPVTSGAGAVRGGITISSDGSRIAYSEKKDSGVDLQRLDFDLATGKTSNPLPLVENKNAMWPDVSPNGEWIAFFEGLNQQQEDIGLIRSDGTGYRKLTDDTFWDRHPRWSPDGKTIAFDSRRSGKMQVWTVHFDGSDLKQLTSGPEGNMYPVWSPDGACLTYHDLADRHSVTIAIDDAQCESPVPNEPSFGEEGTAFIAWWWSPDGALLAGWLRGSSGQNVGIAVYSTETGEFERLTDYGRNPFWLSDSHRLLFFGPGGPSLVDIRTKQVHSVTGLDLYGSGTMGTISPENKYIYTSIGEKEADIWLLTLND